MNFYRTFLLTPQTERSLRQDVTQCPVHVKLTELGRARCGLPAQFEVTVAYRALTTAGCSHLTSTKTEQDIQSEAEPPTS